jgi:hypothetical protein
MTFNLGRFVGRWDCDIGDLTAVQELKKCC